nr:hypothetical protein [Tanacetum cinerariifolium]
MVYSDRGCRILMGWNSSVVNVMIIHMSKQSVFCLIVSINGRFKVFCSFVYASNAGRERRTLWKDLDIQKRFTNVDPWILMGDFIVTLKIEEHCAGSSFVSTDMSEFHNCVDAYEIDDLKSFGFFFTWSKSPQQPTTSIFKKLDRVMINDGLLQKSCKSHAYFLPYMSSDHYLAIFIVPNEVDKKVRSFRFTNYIAEKEDFIPNVRKDGTLRSLDFICSECNMFTKTFSYKDAKRMVTDVTKKEIKEAMFDIGRLIQDNILITRELLRGYNRKNGQKRRAMKIDVYGYFKCGKGLRQGDPIYLYLLTLVMEVFSLIMQKNINESQSYNWSVKVVKKSLDEYSQVSGLHPNMSKSTIFFGSLNKGERARILNIMLFTMSKLPMKYLGLEEQDVIIWWETSTNNACLGFYERNSGDSCEGKEKIAWKLICRPKDQGGNGMNTSMWYDKRHPQGPLCALISRRARYEAGLSKSVNVSDMVEDGK